MRGILLTVGVALVIGCAGASGGRAGERGDEGETDVRFLALGDSYTIGEGVAAEERWPAQLVARLRERGVEIDDPEIIAVTGWTTDELSAGIDAARPDGPYELVTLLIGVNDQYRGRAVDEFQAQFRALLERAVGFAGGDAEHVVVLSIPDWRVTPFAEGRDRDQVAREIDAFNAAAREEAGAAGARWVDITPTSRRTGVDPAYLVADGLHPSGRMYAEWTAQALPAVLAALGVERVPRAE